MPTGDFNSIPRIIQELWNIRPRSILDVGPGFGKWGVLAREYLEVYGNKRFKKQDWIIRIDAVEVNDEYMNIIKDFAYDHVFWKPIQELESSFNYDLVLMLDVIEHMSKSEGVKVLKKLMKSCKNIIVLTPSKLSMTKSKWNEYEDHKCVWSIEEFKRLGFQKIEALEHGPILAMWKHKT